MENPNPVELGSAPSESEDKDPAASLLKGAIVGLLIAAAGITATKGSLEASAHEKESVGPPAVERPEPEPVKSPIMTEPVPEIILAEPYKVIRSFEPIKLYKGRVFPEAKILHEGGIRLQVPSNFQWFRHDPFWLRPQQSLVSEKVEEIQGFELVGKFMNHGGGNHELGVYITPPQFAPDKDDRKPNTYHGPEIGFVMTEDGWIRFYQSINNNQPSLRWQETVIARSSDETRFFNVMIKPGGFLVHVGTPDYQRVETFWVKRADWLQKVNFSSGCITATAQNMGGSGTAVMDIESIGVLRAA